MEVNRVQNVNNKYNQTFGSIKSLNYLGPSWDYSGTTKIVYDAFESSKVLNKFCNKNDVNVSFILDKMGNSFKVATLKIEKIFPEKKLNLWNKFLNKFKEKDEQIIYINAYGPNSNISKERLADKIYSIDSEKDIKDFWQSPYDEFNGISKRKPKWVKDWINSYY